MKLSRRRFLLAGAAGGCLLIGYGLFKPRDLLGDASELEVHDDEVALNAWLKIDSDNVVTVAVPRAEMGQGIYSALAMLVAEELDIEWHNVRAEQAPIAKVYANIMILRDSAPLDPNDHGRLAQSVRWTLARAARVLGVQVTGGSTSVRDAWLPMRSAGAAARDMLMRAAAARMGVAVGELETNGGEIVHAASGRSLNYGAVAAEAAVLAPPSTIVLRDRQAYRHLGKPRGRLDIPAKLDGSARFGIDTRIAGMHYAAIRISPVVAGRLRAVDTTVLEANPGVVKAVVLDDAVAVIARSYWYAEQALNSVHIEFDDGANADLNTQSINAALTAALDDGDGYAYENRGNARKALQGADVVRAEYSVPLLAHACMEPMNCTVRIDAQHAEIWCGNQAPDLFRRLAANALRLAPERVTLHSPLLGGGFGRRAEADVMLRAIAIARALPATAVQLIYSREQDLQHDTYRPAARSRFAARLDQNGHIAAWHHHIASPSVSQAVLARAFPKLPLGVPDKTNAEGAAFLPYHVPQRRVEHSEVASVIPVGFWRSVGHSFNAFFSECFMDEMANAAGRDPIAFRLTHLAHRPRTAHVLTLARDLGNWLEPLPAGHARGVALHESFHSIVAQIAEISIENAQIKVHRVVCVIDCGQVVNPDTVMAQMESGIVYGLTAALFGEVKVANGRIQQWNFPDYRMLNLREMPRIETHVVASGGKPGGVGEPGTPPIAPAVANALALLTGKRQRSLPLKL